MKIYHKKTRVLIFEGSNLRFAYLSDADLSGAHLSGANISFADLFDADLSGADLSGANISFADLSGADLSDADLSGADLSGADLSGADLSGSNLRGAILPCEVLKMAKIKYVILGKIQEKGCALKMDAWHTCDTVHCLAGWAVVLHPQGAELEKKYGTNAAASLIFAASGFPKIPNFYGTEEEAIKWLKN